MISLPLLYSRGFHERPPPVNHNLRFGGFTRGRSPLVGGAAFFAAWGEPSRPGLPLGETGKGRSNSSLPQAVCSLCSRLDMPNLLFLLSAGSAFHRRFLLPLPQPPTRPASIRTL